MITSPTQTVPMTAKSRSSSFGRFICFDTFLHGAHGALEKLMICACSAELRESLSNHL